MASSREVNNEQVEPNPVTADVFLFRMLGGISTGLSVILVAYSVSLVFEQIPSAKSLLIDFDIALSPTTLFVVRVPWMPLVISIASLVLSALATFSTRRLLLVLGWFLALVSLATILWYRYALGAELRSLLGGIGG